MSQPTVTSIEYPASSIEFDQNTQVEPIRGRYVLERQTFMEITNNQVKLTADEVGLKERFTIHEIRDTSILTNKPNFQKPKMNLTPYLTINYKEKRTDAQSKNKPNQTQIENPSRYTQYEPRGTGHESRFISQFPPQKRVCEFKPSNGRM